MPGSQKYQEKKAKRIQEQKMLEEKINEENLREQQAYESLFNEFIDGFEYIQKPNRVVRSSSGTHNYIFTNLNQSFELPASLKTKK